MLYNIPVRVHPVCDAANSGLAEVRSSAETGNRSSRLTLSLQLQEELAWARGKPGSTLGGVAGPFQGQTESPMTWRVGGPKRTG